MKIRKSEDRRPKGKGGRIAAVAIQPSHRWTPKDTDGKPAGPGLPNAGVASSESLSGQSESATNAARENLCLSASICGSGLRNERRYALCRGLGFWELTFEGRHAIFKHEQGALYAVWLLLQPPPEPIHALALALEARSIAGQPGAAAEIIQQRSIGLDDAETIRRLRRQQRALAAVLEDERQIEPVKAEARRESEEIADFLRQNSWRSRDSAQKCVRALSMAIKRFHTHLARARDAEGKPHPVLQAFARHLYDRLLIPSGRGRRPGGVRVAAALAGCFTYEPPPGVVWSAERRVRDAAPDGRRGEEFGL